MGSGHIEQLSSGTYRAIVYGGTDPITGKELHLKETHANHLGKLAFRHVYWNVLLPGRPIPLPAHMSMAGKHVPTKED